MAKTSYLTISPELDDLYYGSLRSGDRFTIPRVVRKDTLISKYRIKGLTNRSLLPECSTRWATLNDTQKAAWATAAGYSSMKGWQLFVQEQCLRIKNEISGLGTPSIFHQGKVGQIRITAPASEIKIAQYHPHTYWISKKVYKKPYREPYKISEPMALPLQIGLSYKSDLVAAGPNPSAKMFAVLTHSIQGIDYETNLEIALGLQDSWNIKTATQTTLDGIYRAYALYIHLVDVTGDLWIDNVKATHSAQNWARDKKCNNIDQTFSKVYYQVPKHWVALTLPVGAEYDSVYVDF